MRRHAPKRFRIVSWSLGLLLLVTGCATDKVAYDLVAYVNQGLLNLKELETKALQEYAAVTGENFTSEQEVYEALKNKVIPIYERFVDGLRTINPKEDEVKRLHGKFIQASAKILDGFKDKMKGIERNQVRTIQRANNMIEEGRIEVEQWRKDFLALCVKHGVAPEKKK
jgi:hypothetical protein